MKIAPSILPRAAVNSVTTPPNDVAPNFEDLLNTAADLETQRQERAFGFSELGMIVPHAVDYADAGQLVEDPITPTANPDVPPVLTATAAEMGVETHRNVAARRAGSNLAAEEGLGERHPTVSQTPARTPIANGPLTPRLEANRTFAAVKLDHGRPSSKPSPLSDRLDAQRVSLVVSGENGTLQVLAGAPELSPEARERLRKAANDLAAVFGVSLTEFTFNGSALEPSFASRIGDRRGYFSS